MRAIIIIGSIVVCLLGCGGDSGGDSADYSSEINDWQSRESACPDINGGYFWGDSLLADLATRAMDIPMFSSTLPADEKLDGYWPASCETAVRGKAICIGSAIYTYRAILGSSGIDQYEGIDVRLRIVQKPEGAHAIVIVYWQGETYQIDSRNVSRDLGHPVLTEFDHKFIF